MVLAPTSLMAELHMHVTALPAGKRGLLIMTSTVFIYRQQLCHKSSTTDYRSFLFQAGWCQTVLASPQGVDVRKVWLLDICNYSSMPPIRETSSTTINEWIFFPRWTVWSWKRLRTCGSRETFRCLYTACARCSKLAHRWCGWWSWFEIFWHRNLGMPETVYRTQQRPRPSRMRVSVVRTLAETLHNYIVHVDLRTFVFIWHRINIFSSLGKVLIVDYQILKLFRL